jgi:hypothetical protein
MEEAIVIERIKTPFGFSSTVDEVVRGIDVTGKQSLSKSHPLVKGCRDGI